MNPQQRAECLEYESAVTDSESDEQVSFNLAIQDIRYHELLNSNEPPLDAECPSIESVVLRLRRCLSRHDDKLARLRAQIELPEQEPLEQEKLEQKRASLATDLSRNAAILSPLRRMPPEILSEIFMLTLPSDRAVVERGKIDLRDSPWMLTRICGRWRTVALASSSLWSFVAINCEDNLSAAYPLSLIRTQLQRAKHIRIHFLAEDRLTQYQMDILQLLVDHSPLWEEVYLLVTPGFLPIITTLHDRIPLLRRVWIECRESYTEAGSNPPQLEAFNCLRGAPVLRDVSLILEDHILSVTLPAHQLTRYHLYGTWEQHIHVLMTAKNLTEARICICDEETSLAAPGTIIELCGLRRLYVSRADVLDFLRLPALHDVAFYHESRELDTMQYLDSIVERSSCVLRRLCVEGLPVADMVTDILRTHQAIAELVVILLEPDSSVDADSLIGHLAGQNTEGVFTLAPQLNGMFFGCQNGNSFDYGLYHDMLLSRWKTGALRSAGLTTYSDSERPDSSTYRRLDALRADGLNLLCVDGDNALTVMWAWALNTYLQWLESG
jgi:hypothetical protein